MSAGVSSVSSGNIPSVNVVNAAFSKDQRKTLPKDDDPAWTADLRNLPDVLFATIYAHLVERQVYFQDVEVLEDIADMRTYVLQPLQPLQQQQIGQKWTESVVVDNNAGEESRGSVEGQMQQIDGNSSRKMTCTKAETR